MAATCNAILRTHEPPRRGREGACIAGEAVAGYGMKKMRENVKRRWPLRECEGESLAN